MILYDEIIAGIEKVKLGVVKFSNSVWILLIVLLGYS